MRHFRGNLQIALLALLTLFGSEFLHFIGHGHAEHVRPASALTVLTADDAASRETAHFTCGDWCPVCAGMLDLDVPETTVAVPRMPFAASCPVPPDMPCLSRFIATAPARAPPAQV